MATQQQIIDYLKQKKAKEEKDKVLDYVMSMNSQAPPAPTSFDVGVSNSTAPVGGLLSSGSPSTEPSAGLTMDDVTRPRLMDQIFSPQMPLEAAPAPQDLAPQPVSPVPNPSPPPPAPKPVSPPPEIPMGAPEKAPGASAMNVIGQALSGLADARSAGAGSRTDFMSGAQRATTQNVAEQKTAQLDDPNTEMSRSAQRTLAKMTGRKPEDFKNVPYSKAVQMFPMVEKAYESEQKGKERAEDRGLKEREFSLKEKEFAQKTAKASGASTKAIPGFVPTGKVEIEDAEAKKLREGVAEYQSFNRALTEYKGMVQKHGTTEVWDRAALAKMNALSKNLQLKVKNLAQLGVLSASDIPFIEKQIPGPGLFQTQSGMMGALDATGKTMSSSVRDRMAVSGYAPDAEMEKLLGGVDEAQDEAQAGKIKVRKGKEEFMIDPADLPDAEKDGFRRL